MFLWLYSLITNIILQTIWDDLFGGGDNWWERPYGETFDGPSLTLWILAWTFFGIGAVCLTILILYTKYGREISIKLSVITIVTGSVLLGLSFHFFLMNAGY
ncbi:MAG: hypothetical protein ACFFAO_02510 [Candidatus Hermodarchaeota archaeon]